MPSRTPLLAFNLALMSVLCSLPTHAQTASQWRAQQLAASEKSERIMQEANRRKGLLARYQAMRYAHAADKDPAFRLIFNQYVSWYQTFVGDYPGAAASFSIRQQPQEDDHPSPLAEAGWQARPALEAIPSLARGYRLVYLNEAHNVPLTRTLSVQLLGRLRREGFGYFAVETIYQTDTGLPSRGYPTEASGFYTEEPISAEMVRTALKLGFKVIGYEALSDATGDARETEQARNIYRETFAKDPQARVVVEAGYAHIQKSGAFLGGSSMAEHLYKLSRIDGLSIEQTMLAPHPARDDDHPFYAQIVEKLQPTVPIVFVNADGKPWTLRGGYDVSVVFPPQRLHRGRPTWLALGGLRRPYPINGDRCERHYPCLVEARYAAEGNDAIPADRIVLDPVPLNATPQDRLLRGVEMPSSELYLRPGKYRLTISDEQDRTIFSRDIDVPEAVAGHPPPAPPA